MKYYLLSFFLCFISCKENNNYTIKPEALEKNNIIKNEGPNTFSLKDFYRYDSRLAFKTDSVFKTLSESEKVSQMIISSIGELGYSLSKAKQLVRDKKVGGFVVLKDTKENYINSITTLNSIAIQSKSQGLLFSSDAEPSLFNSRITGTEKIKRTIDIKTVEESDSIARTIAKVLKQVGVHQNYAPVIDISTNNKAIKSRSFGSNNEKVITLANAFIQSTQAENIVATAKHFPGHGLVNGDTHFNTVYIDGDLHEVNNYKPIIENDIISIMVAHISIKNNTKYNTYDVPASCSRKIVTGLLKDELNFKGIIISDGMKMKALEKIPNATLEASKAGCDIILIPEDEDKIMSQILQEMRINEVYKTQVYESVMKIIRLKLCLGII